MATQDRISEADGEALSRRAVIRSAAVAGAAVASGLGLAACSSDSGSSTYQTDTSGGAAAGAGASGDTGGGGTGGGAAIAQTTDITVGGGKVVDVDGSPVVVTQPSEGKFAAFSAICTHQQCTVNKVSKGLIRCPCHGSEFSATDGSPKAGPAPSGLPAVNITVQGTSILKA